MDDPEMRLLELHDDRRGFESGNIAANINHVLADMHTRSQIAGRANEETTLVAWMPRDIKRITADSR